jgi:hypothetical protein
MRTEGAGMHGEHPSWIDLFTSKKGDEREALEKTMIS